jgi:hypothetical protein
MKWINARKQVEARDLVNKHFPTPAAYISMKVPCLFGILEVIVLGIHVMLANWGKT